MGGGRRSAFLQARTRACRSGPCVRRRRVRDGSSLDCAPAKGDRRLAGFGASAIISFIPPIRCKPRLFDVAQPLGETHARGRLSGFESKPARPRTRQARGEVHAGRHPSIRPRARHTDAQSALRRRRRQAQNPQLCNPVRRPPREGADDGGARGRLLAFRFRRRRQLGPLRRAAAAHRIPQPLQSATEPRHHVRVLRRQWKSVGQRASAGFAQGAGRSGGRNGLPARSPRRARVLPVLPAGEPVPGRAAARVPRGLALLEMGGGAH